MVAVEAAAIGRAGDEAAVGDGIGGGGEHLAIPEDVAGVAGHGGGFVHVHAGARVDEDELGEAHVHHGAAGGADVATVDGIDEHDSDVVQRRHIGGMIAERGRKTTARRWARNEFDSFEIISRLRGEWLSYSVRKSIAGRTIPVPFKRLQGKARAI